MRTEREGVLFIGTPSVTLALGARVSLHHAFYTAVHSPQSFAIQVTEQVPWQLARGWRHDLTRRDNGALSARVTEGVPITLSGGDDDDGVRKSSTLCTFSG